MNRVKKFVEMLFQWFAVPIWDEAEKLKKRRYFEMLREEGLYHERPIVHNWTIKSLYAGLGALILIGALVAVAIYMPDGKAKWEKNAIPKEERISIREIQEQYRLDHLFYEEEVVETEEEEYSIIKDDDGVYRYQPIK